MTKRAGAEAHRCRPILGRAGDGISQPPRAGREDHGEADAEGAGGNGSTYWINGYGAQI